MSIFWFEVGGDNILMPYKQGYDNFVTKLQNKINEYNLSIYATVLTHV